MCGSRIEPCEASYLSRQLYEECSPGSREINAVIGMRCFKSFFKHTWHPQQMDNPKRLGSPTKACNVQSANETELGELRVARHEAQTVGRGLPCHNGACKTSGLKNRAEHRLESPWHYLKTLFLVSMIVALIVWIVVYVMLNHYDLL